MRLEVALEDFGQSRHEDHKQDRRDIRDSLMTLHGVCEEDLDFIERAMLLYGRPDDVDGVLNDENETTHSGLLLVRKAVFSLRRATALIRGEGDEIPFSMTRDSFLAWFKGTLAVASDPRRGRPVVTYTTPHSHTTYASDSSESDPPPRGD